MNYKIVERSAMSVFGVEKIFSTENGENLKEIPQFWAKLMHYGIIDDIAEVAGEKWDGNSSGIKAVNAVMNYDKNDGENFHYMIYAPTPLNRVPDRYKQAKIPAGTWAVFRSEEHKEEEIVETVQSLWQEAYSNRFDIENYEPGDGAQFEKYGVADSGKEYCEVWVPVVKKQ